MFKNIILILAVLLFTGCSASDGGAKLASLRPDNSGMKTFDSTISRKAYIDRLSQPSLNTIRLVEIFKGGSSKGSPPEYRLFSIQPMGVYALLGIKNNDVLVAANEFVVRQPKQFLAFTELLQNEKSATIELRRQNNPILMRYTFVD